MKIKDSTTVSIHLMINNKGMFGFPEAITVEAAGYFTVEDYNNNEMDAKISGTLKPQMPSNLKIIEYMERYNVTDERSNIISEWDKLLTSEDIERIAYDEKKEGVSHYFDYEEKKPDEPRFANKYFLSDDDINSIHYLTDFAKYLSENEYMDIYIDFSVTYSGGGGSAEIGKTVISEIDEMSDVAIMFQIVAGEGTSLSYESYKNYDEEILIKLAPRYVAEEEWNWFYQGFFHADDNIRDNAERNIKDKLFIEKNTDYISEWKNTYEENNEGKKWNRLNKEDKVEYVMENLSNADWQWESEMYWEMFIADHEYNTKK